MFKVTFFQVFLNKHLLSGSRKIPGNNICNPAFPGITKWLYRGNTDLVPAGAFANILNLIC
jgi:hypothetical protein